MLDVRNLVPMDNDQAVKLAEASNAKALELKAAHDVIAERFAGQKRISLDTVLKALTDSIAEYTQGADPSYWTNPAPAPVAVANVDPEVPGVLEPTTETPADETPKGRRK
jgi:hypothetical protein